MSEQRKVNEASKTDGINAKRRYLAKAGAVTPILMVLGQRPAFGAICSVSGHISATPGNISGQRHVVDSCGGLSPGAFKTPDNGDGTWPFDCIPGDFVPGETKEGWGKRTGGTTMDAAFGFSGYHSGETLYDVLWHYAGDGSDHPGEDTYELGAHLIAALLHAKNNEDNNVSGRLSVSSVKDMYIQLSSTGSYEPKFSGGFFDLGNGEVWSSEDVVRFIQQTFH